MTHLLQNAKNCGVGLLQGGSKQLENGQLHNPSAIELIPAIYLVLAIAGGHTPRLGLGSESRSDRGTSGDNGRSRASKGKQTSSRPATARQIHDEAVTKQKRKSTTYMYRPIGKQRLLNE